MKKSILSVHYGHDATVVYIQDGKIAEAMSEERLSRQKKHLGFPHKSLAYVRKKYNLRDEDIDTIYVVGENPAWDSHIFVTEEDNKSSRSESPIYKDHLHSLQFAMPGALRAFNFYYALKDKFTRHNMAEKVTAFLTKEFPKQKIVRLHHHMAHAWATIPFMDNPSLEYLIFTLDGAGDNISGSVNILKDGKITRVASVPFDSSIGLLYSAVVDILGMKRNEHEFKVMGLAPYAKATSGEKVYEALKKIFWFDKETMTFVSSIPTSKATGYFIANNYHRYRFDSIAYGIQKLTEECMKDMIRAYIEKYKIYNIALGGGVFMNVKANQTILAMPEVKTLVIAPSCGDESLAIGSAVYGFVQEGNNIQDLAPIHDLYLGSEYTAKEIKEAIDIYKFNSKVTVENCEGTSTTIEKKVAELLAANNVVGRFKGRAEWGARALGNRSILANASSRDTVKLINEMIKGRDFWMPFATSMIHEDQYRYLHNEKNFFAPYMSITFNTKEKAVEEIPAALHPYDLTSRPQMVTEGMNRDYHLLLSEFKAITGYSGILNTSFNIHGEPNVESPFDALRTLDHSGLRYLALGDYLISKTEN
jgi:carbamoyltransferase